MTGGKNKMMVPLDVEIPGLCSRALYKMAYSVTR